MSLANLVELDRKHVWHPYSSMPMKGPCFPVVRAEGCTLYLQYDSSGSSGSSGSGNNNNSTVIPVVDGMSSWWSAIHGYNHPHLNQAIVAQLDQMAHVMFGGLTHEPAVRLAHKLAQITPGELQHVFFSDSGSVAVEVAMKMAQQYMFQTGLLAKRSFLTVRGGYHGDTYLAMSVCDPLTGMHHMFQMNLPQQYFADRPTPDFYDTEKEWDDDHMYSLKGMLMRHGDQICAVILEPIVQGAGGMRFYHPTFLRRVRELCLEFNTLLICDEIATGFGRTGKLFACEYADICPDILCLGKALTGGYMSFAATLCTPTVAQAFSASASEAADHPSGDAAVLMHGPTFMANPLACAVSLASLELLETTTDYQTLVPRIEAQLKEELLPCLTSEFVKDVRVLGAIGVVELKRNIEDFKSFQHAVVREGVWLRPFGKLVYTMPPFTIQHDELAKIGRAIRAITKFKY